VVVVRRVPKTFVSCVTLGLSLNPINFRLLQHVPSPVHKAHVTVTCSDILRPMAYYTLWTTKRWQYIWKILMDFYNFCTVVNRKKCFTQTWQKCPLIWITYLRYLLKMKHHISYLYEHLYNALLEYYSLDQAEWQTRWHNPPDWGLVSSVATCLVPWSVIQRRVYETRVHDIDELRQQLGAVADWWRSWPMAMLVFVPVADILNILCDYQFVFSVLDELYVTHHAWCNV